eukprot:5709179-Amphidinium_carterae.1
MFVMVPSEGICLCKTVGIHRKSRYANPCLPLLRPSMFGWFSIVSPWCACDAAIVPSSLVQTLLGVISKPLRLDTFELSKAFVELTHLCLRGLQRMKWG